MAHLLLLSMSTLLVLCFSPTAAFFNTTIHSGAYISFRADDNHKNLTYQSNVETLFANLISNLSSSVKFSNATLGVGSDRVYGLLLCNDDLSLKRCLSCIREASAFVSPACPNPQYPPDWPASAPRSLTCPVALFAWFDKCYVYYSAVDHARAKDSIRNETTVGCGPTNITQTQSTVRLRLMEDLVEEAVRMRAMFAARSYGLVQCVRDMTVEECRRCLRGGLEYSANAQSLGGVYRCDRKDPVHFESGNCRLNYSVPKSAARRLLMSSTSDP